MPGEGNKNAYRGGTTHIIRIYIKHPTDYRFIVANLNTEERAQALLKAAREKARKRDE